MDKTLYEDLLLCCWAGSTEMYFLELQQLLYCRGKKSYWNLVLLKQDPTWVTVGVYNYIAL